MSIIIAVDIGGTQMRAAAYTQDQVLPLQQKKIPTLASKPGGLDRLSTVLEDVWPKDQQVAAIGIGSPGPLDPHTGYLLAPPNNPEWHNFPLAPRVQEHFGVQTFLDNDANLAGLGERRLRRRPRRLAGLAGWFRVGRFFGHFGPLSVRG